MPCGSCWIRLELERDSASTTIASQKQRIAFLERELDEAEDTIATLEKGKKGGKPVGSDDEDDEDEDLQDKVRNLEKSLTRTRRDLDAAEEDLDQERAAHAKTQKDMERLSQDLAKAKKSSGGAASNVDVEDLTSQLISSKLAAAEAQFQAETSMVEKRKVAKELAREKLKMLDLQKKLTQLEVKYVRK